MKILREKLIAVWKKLLRAYADYRVTVSAVALLTIYGAVENFLYIFDYSVRKKLPVFICFEYSEEISVSLLLLICGALFTESLLPYVNRERRTKTVRLLCFLLTAVIAVLVGVGMTVKESAQIFHVSGSLINEWVYQFTGGYALLLLLGTVYLCHRKSGVGFTEYMLHVLANLCVTTAVYLVLMVGVSLVLAVVDTLFVERGMDSFASTGVIMVTGLYYAPCCITALCNMDSEIDNTPGKFLLRDVLTGMTICAMVVVYAYLLKVLILWEIPSNEIFSIVTGLFCFGMPIWIMDYYYRDETRYMRFVQKLPYGLIPLIPIQIYAMGVRIYEHGMTPSRYMGMGMVVIEAAVLLMWHLWKENMERMLLFLCVCVAIIFFVPGINANSLSDRWQRSFLATYYQKLLTEGSLTQTEAQRLKGAYKYLKYRPETEAVLERYNIYEESFAEKLAETGMDMETYTQLETHRIHCCQMVGSLDVAGYSRFDMLNQDAGYEETEENMLPVDFSAFRFYKREDGAEELITVDISDFAKRCMDYEKEHPNAGEDEISAAMKPYQRIELADGRVLYLNHFQMRYQEGIKDGEAYFEIESVNVSGMLLEQGLPLMDDTALLVTENCDQKFFAAYEFDGEGRMLRKLGDGICGYNDREYEYDAEGNCRKESHYFVSQKNAGAKSLESWVDYSYGKDETGQPIRTAREYYDSGSLRSICVYDNEEKRRKETVYRESGALWSEYLYDTSACQQWLTNYDEVEQVERRYRTDYDEQGSVILHAVYDGEGNEIGDDGDCDCGPEGFDFWGRRFEYEYDENGNLIRQTGFDEKDNRTGYIEKSYDEHGNLIKETIYDAEDIVMYYEKNAYDENDHLVFHFYVNTVESGYDSDGRGRKERYEYDGAGRCIREWARYCDEGEDEEEIPPEDSVYIQWERTYDEQGRLIRYMDRDKRQYDYIYTAIGDLGEDYPYDRINVR